MKRGHQGPHGLKALNGRIDTCDVEGVSIGVLLQVGEEIRMTSGSGRSDEHDALRHRGELESGVPSNRPLLLQSRQGFLPPPLHFSEQRIEVDALDVQGETVHSMKRHVRAEHDLPAGLQDFIELRPKLLSDDRQPTAPNGPAKLRQPPASLLLNEVEVAVLAREAALADFGPDPEEAPPVRSSSICSTARVIRLNGYTFRSGVEAALDGVCALGRHGSATYP